MIDFFKNQRYLPKWFRDFHVQKHFFKTMHYNQAKGYVRKAQKGDEPSIRMLKSEAYQNFNWVDSHCYVIDRFLWYMAKCGYTLQKDKRFFGQPGSIDIFKEMDEYTEIQNQEFFEMLKQDQKEK